MRKIKTPNTAKNRELERQWHAMLFKWGAEQKQKRIERAMDAEPLVYNISAPAGRPTHKDIPSRVTAGGSTALKDTSTYTGTAMRGIGTLHKSNAVPVFSDEEAVEMACMRR